jgi:hypothetical protein
MGTFEVECRHGSLQGHRMTRVLFRTPMVCRYWKANDQKAQNQAKRRYEVRHATPLNWLELDPVRQRQLHNPIGSVVVATPRVRFVQSARSPADDKYHQGTTPCHSPASTQGPLQSSGGSSNHRHASDLHFGNHSPTFRGPSSRASR